MVGIVVGGAFFGDNLSFISDTTIAATRTQGCAMRDKFRVNFMIALPAALIVFSYYIFRGMDIMTTPQIQSVEWVKVTPYLVVLGTAIAGMNVTLVLIWELPPQESSEYWPEASISSIGLVLWEQVSQEWVI